MTTQDILSRLQGVKGVHGQWTARCPAHDDQQNSLSVGEGDDGRVLLRCHAGCNVDRIPLPWGSPPPTYSRTSPATPSVGTIPSPPKRKGAPRLWLHTDT